MTICRVKHDKHNPYTLINTTIATDDRLSWKSKGIWLYAFSRPDDWTFYMNDLIKRSKDGVDSLRGGLKELQEFGYLHRQMARCKKTGKAEGHDWIFFETSKSEDEIKIIITEMGLSPTSDNPDVGEIQPLPIIDSIPSIKEQQTEATPVVVFPCLLNLEKEIAHSHKVRISETYLEAHVEHAVKVFDKSPKESMLSKSAVLESFCKQARDTDCKQPEMPYSKEGIIEENKKHLKGLKVKHYDIIGLYRIEKSLTDIEFYKRQSNGLYSERAAQYLVDSPTFKADVEKFIKMIEGS